MSSKLCAGSVALVQLPEQAELEPDCCPSSISLSNSPLSSYPSFLRKVSINTAAQALK